MKQEFTIPENTDKISVEEINGGIIIKFIEKIIPNNGDIVSVEYQISNYGNGYRTGIYNEGYVTFIDNKCLKVYSNTKFKNITNKQKF